ncbi:MAG TPA: NAD-dependent epimerase/dehydratase family protein [Micromonosporaceae bacterium]|nr:NAD-dependent epimerase/dehydratase family protein [Micromonosporaceae bacterium]
MPQLAGEHILVTGGAGFIGRTVVASLASAGAHVTVVDRANYAEAVPDPLLGVDSIVGELRNPDVRDAAVTDSVSGIVHLAAITSVLGSLADPAAVHAANVDVTAGLLELARRRGVPRFVLASTNAVTGDVGTSVIHEGLPLRPLTPYGATKAAAEMLLSGYAGGYGMTTCSLRLTNVYGPGMARKDSFIPRLMRAARDGTTIQVYGDGAQRRDLVHVTDVVQGLLVAWSARHVGPLIIGGGRSVSVLDMLAAVHEATGRDIAIEHVPQRSGEMPAVIVSIEKARSLGYEPAIDLARGLRTVWNDLRYGDA